MKILLSYARSTFWTIGIVTVLLSASVLVSAVLQAGTKPIHAVAGVIVSMIVGGFGAVTCLAARALRKQGRFAKTMVAFASIYSLPIFPFGTVAGGAGLYWCFSRKMRSVEPLLQDFDFKPKKGDGTHQWMQLVVSVCSIAIILGSLGAAQWWGVKHDLPRSAAINGLVVLLLGDWISAFFHELGHAIAGRLAGMRLAVFSVGPLAARKKAGRWKFGFSPMSLLGLGGSVATVPIHLHNLRRRMALEIAAGPIASLMTAFAAMAVLSTMPGSSWIMWWKVPAVVAAISAGSLVLNLIPFRAAAGYSDGALLVQLLGGGPFADVRIAAKMIGTTTVTATRPRDLDPSALSRAATAPAGECAAMVPRMLQLICAVDRGDLALARACLESVLEVVPNPEKVNDPAVAVEIGFYIAYLDGHAGRASQWLRDTEALAASKKHHLMSEFDYWLSVAAVRRVENRDAEAEDAWGRAKYLADRRPKVGLYDYERDLVDRVRGNGWLRPPEEIANEALGSPAVVAV